VQEAASRDSPLLTNLLGREIARWREQAGQWSQGHYSVGENN
jgi:hypothetical protein